MFTQYKNLKLSKLSLNYYISIVLKRDLKIALKIYINAYVMRIVFYNRVNFDILCKQEGKKYSIESKLVTKSLHILCNK